MERNETQSNSSAGSHPRRYAYTKVLDNRKHPIRGLWRRNGKFVARITVENELGRRQVKWVPIDGATAAQAQDEIRKLLVERSEHRLRHLGRTPEFGEYLDTTYLPRLATAGKKPETLVTEKGHLGRWREALGHLRLDKIRPHHVTAHLQRLKEQGRAARTCNLALVMLRNVFKSARIDGFIKAFPVDGIPWQRTEKKSRALCTRQDIERICTSAFGSRLKEKGQSLPVTKNAQEFVDYIRLLSLTGAREQEAIKIRWADVDFERGFLTVGADADTKNREARHVDLNPQLESHLRDMATRRAPDSSWLFPSPQRGERDARAKTFRESLLLVREAAGMPAFGFHDLRHHFISYAVMSGVDFMTIARWVGHKDGGVLIGKVYGHLSNEHARAQAAKLNFGPEIVELPQAASN